VVSSQLTHDGAGKFLQIIFFYEKMSQVYKEEWSLVVEVAKALLDGLTG
jgi:hypothetical protein